MGGLAKRKGWCVLYELSNKEKEKTLGKWTVHIETTRGRLTPMGGTGQNKSLLTMKCTPVLRKMRAYGKNLSRTN